MPVGHQCITDFYALQTVKSREELFCYVQPEDASGQLDYRYDEFGYKVEEEGSPACCISLCHYLRFE